MAGEWRETTLGNVLTLQRGFDLPETDRKGGPYEVIASTGSVGTHDKAMVQGPGVVIGRSGSLGGGQFIERDFWPLNTTLWVKDFKGNDRRFCYYLLKSLDLAHFNAGSGVPTLNRNHIHPLPVTVPPLPEQRAIAHILGTLDDKIELNRRMSETLEAMARALFKSWFVDFDPVRAKCRGDLKGRSRWRRGQSLPLPAPQSEAARQAGGLPGTGGFRTRLYDDLFPDRLVDSELGPIPEGWRVGRLGDVLVQSIDRCRPSDDTRLQPYVPIECIAARSLLLAESRPGDEAQSSLTRFRKGQILFGAMRPYFHKVAIAPFDGTTRTTVFVLRPRQPGDFSFATLLLHDAKTIEYATNHSTGSTIPYAVWQGSLASMPIVLPPMVIRKSFDQIARALIDRIPPVFFLNRTLAALRDALLPKLISGKLRVKDAERFLKERGL